MRRAFRLGGLATCALALSSRSVSFRALSARRATYSSYIFSAFSAEPAAFSISASLPDAQPSWGGRRQSPPS